MDHHEGFRLCEHDLQLVPERNPPTSDRKRDPIMMHSLVKYSVMELQKTIQHDIMEKLNEFTEVGVGDLGDLGDLADPTFSAQTAPTFLLCPQNLPEIGGWLVAHLPKKADAFVEEILFEPCSQVTRKVRASKFLTAPKLNT